MGYCVSCGMISETVGGLCRSCERDFEVSQRKVRVFHENQSVDVAYLTRSARRNADKQVGFAMLQALANADSIGFEYGWS